MLNYEGTCPAPDTRGFEAALFGGPVAQGITLALPSQFIEMFRQMTGLLPEQIALLEENWDIATANTSWVRSARRLGHAGLEIGGNYKEFCTAKAAEGDGAAIGMLRGIEHLDSAGSSFSFVHEGLGVSEGSIFQICLRRAEVDGRAMTVATRTDIADLGSLRKRVGEILVEGRADERRRLARELHDSTMQQLHCLKLGLGQLKRTNPPEEANQIVDEMEAILGDAQSELRTMSYLAHPPLLEELGLQQALQKLVDGFTRRSSVHTSLQWTGRFLREDHSADAVLYRVVQEALSNVSRHAGANTVHVRILVGDDFIEARIMDDGVGMPRCPVSGVGLEGMRARLDELSGQLKIRSTKSGTEIIATVPRRANSRRPRRDSASLKARDALFAGFPQPGQFA